MKVPEKVIGGKDTTGFKRERKETLPIPDANLMKRRAAMALFIVGSTLGLLKGLEGDSTPTTDQSKPNLGEQIDPSKLTPQELAKLRNGLDAASYLLGKGAYEAYQQASARQQFLTEALNTNLSDLDADALLEKGVDRRLREGTEANIPDMSEDRYNATAQQGKDEYLRLAEQLVVEQDDRTIYMYVPNEPNLEATLYLSTYAQPNGEEIPAVMKDSPIGYEDSGAHVSHLANQETAQQAVTDTIQYRMDDFLMDAWSDSMKKKYGEKEE